MYLIEDFVGNEVEKGLMGLHDESKGIFYFLTKIFSIEYPMLVVYNILVPYFTDQGACENNIPLSPQWLYARPTETKMVSFEALVQCLLLSVLV